MMKLLIRLLIRFYQICISPILHCIGGTNCGCRFTPTCSQYFLDAVQIHGVFKGSILGVRRIFRCAPWGGQGHDPVPLRIEINCEDAEKNL
ncbi:MAG: membrane protein insertion efficiency factor YidD [Verrucomicrobiales bacterium]|nr:membrane protein insertion efficiency factor YidD [Verrucomicrobiales bacterium]